MADKSFFMSVFMNHLSLLSKIEPNYSWVGSIILDSIDDCFRLVYQKSFPKYLKDLRQWSAHHISVQSQEEPHWEYVHYHIQNWQQGRIIGKFYSKASIRSGFVSS